MAEVNDFNKIISLNAGPHLLKDEGLFYLPSVLFLFISFGGQRKVQIVAADGKREDVALIVDGLCRFNEIGTLCRQCIVQILDLLIVPHGGMYSA